MQPSPPIPGQPAPKKSNACLIVAIILGVIAVLVLGVGVVAAMAWKHVANDTVQQAKQARTESDIQALSAQLLMYRARAGQLPTTDQGLSALVEKPSSAPVPSLWTQLLESVPMDGWGHPYRYAAPGKHSTNSYDLWSVGPDGVDGTSDDIGNWK